MQLESELLEQCGALLTFECINARPFTAIHHRRADFPVSLILGENAAVGRFPRTNAALRDSKPLIIRINDVGKAEAVNFSNFAYRPQEADNRYFLSQWAQLFYSRNRYTVQKDFTRALLFLNGDLQAATIDQNKKSKAIEGFLSDPTAPNTDIEIKNVSIEDLRSAPYRARIEFFKIVTSPIDHSELKRELWTANVVYVFRDQVPNDMLLVNPLGLTITYFREDQAFEK